MCDLESSNSPFVGVFPNVRVFLWKRCSLAPSLSTNSNWVTDNGMKCPFAFEYIFQDIETSDTNNRALIHIKILRKVVLDGRYDGLDEFQEENEVHVHVQILAALLHDRDEPFHDVGVSERDSVIKRG